MLPTQLPLSGQAGRIKPLKSAASMPTPAEQALAFAFECQENGGPAAVARRLKRGGAAARADPAEEAARRVREAKQRALEAEVEGVLKVRAGWGTVEPRWEGGAGRARVQSVGSASVWATSPKVEPPLWPRAMPGRGLKARAAWRAPACAASSACRACCCGRNTPSAGGVVKLPSSPLLSQAFSRSSWPTLPSLPPFLPQLAALPA